jgi:DNA repair exonuclease SbcCD ATPase subunit
MNITDHTALLALITGVLGALSVFAVRVWGAPERRMKHHEALEKIAADMEAKRGAAQERLISSWERRAEKLETKQTLLDDANQSLRARIDELEKQVARAGSIHVADLATIANLREELDRYMARCEAHEIDLAKRNRQIADLEARVAELEAALSGCPVGPACKAAKKAVSAKKKGGKPSAR